MSLGRWTGLRVSVVAVAWVLISAGFFLWRAFQALAMTGSTGIAAVSTGVGAAELFVPVFGPPLILLLSWLVLRRRAATVG